MTGEPSEGRAPAGERRVGSRADVELEVGWRRRGSTVQFVFASISNLSVRGCRVGGWTDLELEVGDEIELAIEPDAVWPATVVRVLTGGEYAVRFGVMDLPLKNRIAATVGRARAGIADHWAT